MLIEDMTLEMLSVEVELLSKIRKRRRSVELAGPACDEQVESLELNR